MSTTGPRNVPTEWVARLASLVAALRTDWDEAGIRSALHRVVDRPLGDVAVAAITAAMTRADQRTPAVIAMNGTHWPNLSTYRGTEPGIITYCEHGRPTGLHCDDCQPVQRALPTDDQRAAMRGAIRNAKAPACTCPVLDPSERAAVYTHTDGTEPHAVDCPRWGMPA